MTTFGSDPLSQWLIISLVVLLSVIVTLFCVSALEPEQEDEAIEMSESSHDSSGKATNIE